jgi:hypothetical protein
VTKQEMEAVVAEELWELLIYSKPINDVILHSKPNDTSFLVHHRGHDYRVTVTKETP